MLNMVTATNQLFCYWLQGYFEIGLDVGLDKNTVMLMRKQLDTIQEPLGEFTSWLKNVCDFIEKLDYKAETCARFCPIIQRSLNSVFYHVIDDTYITEERSREKLLDIHVGKKHDE